MAATFLVVPQWQGSGSSRAMRLFDGAEAIRSDLPPSATITVDVPSEAGSDEGSGVLRLSSLRQVRGAHLTVLEGVTGRAITIGGDAGVDLSGVQGAAAKNDRMALIWLGAHPDLNTPESSSTGAFHGMVLRTLLGEGPSSLVAETPLDPSLVILAGTRAMDDAELAYLESTQITHIGADRLGAEAITAALVTSGATSVYLHIDLDILDPAHFDSLGFPEPFGATLALVLEVIAAAATALPLVGAAITEFAPASSEAAEDELGSILRIVGALAR